MAEPALLLPDEPTSHQDAASEALVLDELRRIADRGGAVLVASHETAVVAAADAVIDLGTIPVRDD